MSRGKEKPTPFGMLRKRKKLSQATVAEMVSELVGEEIGQGAISSWEIGRTDLKNVHPKRLRAYATVLDLTTVEFASLAGYQEEDLFSEKELVIEIDEVERIPIRSLAVAKTSIFTEQNITGYVSVLPELYRPKMQIVEYRSDGLLPHITYGCLIFIDTSLLDAAEGKLYLVYHKTYGFDIKRARFVNNQLIFMSDNPTYPVFMGGETSILGQAYRAQPPSWEI